MKKIVSSIKRLFRHLKKIGLRKKHILEMLCQKQNYATSLKPRILYLSPMSHVPSWGQGTLHQHINLLCKNGFDAYIVAHKKNNRMKWLSCDVPVLSADDKNFSLSKNDLIVIPEIWGFRDVVKNIECRKMVFVQNAFYILTAQETGVDYREFGYESALVPMKHLLEIVARYHHPNVHMIPLSVPGYFFHNTEDAQRDKTILIYPKQKSFDYQILKKILTSELPLRYPEWKVVELEGYSHREVAEIMRKSMFFINVNSYEAFNTSVPEAMAAGCICFCFQAFGGRDFLKDGENAFVFQNNDVYPLLTKFFDVLKQYASLQKDLDKVRTNGKKTMLNYKEQVTEAELVKFYERILPLRTNA